MLVADPGQRGVGGGSGSRWATAGKRGGAGRDGYEDDADEDEDAGAPAATGFQTAKSQLIKDLAKKGQSYQAMFGNSTQARE